jgi:hypothetical protein
MMATTRPATSTDVREQLVSALDLDLIGPGPGSELEDELLPQAPSRWYLAGYLAPVAASEDQRSDETATEELDAGGERAGVDEDPGPDATAAKRSYLPSSMGLSLLVAAGVESLDVIVRWGDYTPEIPSVIREDSDVDYGVSDETDEDEAEANEAEADDEDSKGDGPSSGPRFWRRSQREVAVAVSVGPAKKSYPLFGAGELQVVVTSRPVGSGVAGVPVGTRSVSVFLVNYRHPGPDDARDTAFVFQAEIEVHSRTPFVPRPDPTGIGGADWDDRLADLQYRDVGEVAVGHNVSTHAECGPDGASRLVKTTWVPRAEVERVAPEPIADTVLGMSDLAHLSDGAAARAVLAPLTQHYREWMKGQTGSGYGSIGSPARGCTRAFGQG